MRISTKARYGLRAMIELALNFDKGYIPGKLISENQAISESYLEQLMSTLVKRGLVKSVRGVQGGYLLALEPENIKVGEIIQALEGPIIPVDCVNREHPAPCPRMNMCVSREVWEMVRDVVEESLNSLSLEDLRLKHQKKMALLNNDEIIDFSI